MKRPAGGEASSGRPTRRPRSGFGRVDFTIETEYVDNVPHIVTVRPIRFPEERIDVTDMARLIARRLIDTTNNEVRRYLRRRRNVRIDYVLNGMFYF